MARSSLDQTLSYSSRSNILPEFYAMFALEERRGSALKEHARARARAQKDTRALASLPCPPPPPPSPRRSLNVENVLSYPWLKLSIRRDATARRILIAS